jgi:two-component system phosphate regulon response regulator PhoB
MNEIARYVLDREGFEVSVACDGESVLERVENARPDLLILDRALPAVSGIEVCRRIRRSAALCELPVIVLTDRAAGEGGTDAREAGADEELAKPFSPGDLLACARAALKGMAALAVAEVRAYAGIVLDMQARRVTRDGRSIHLGPTEFRLLAFLLDHPAHVFSRAQLLERVWGRGLHVEARTVDVYVRRLRKALNGPGERDVIRTVRTAGYALDERGHDRGPAGC